jgi:hypothetical protein
MVWKGLCAKRCRVRVTNFPSTFFAFSKFPFSSLLLFKIFQPPSCWFKSLLRWHYSKKRQKLLSCYFQSWNIRAFRALKVKTLSDLKMKSSALRRWKRAVRSSQFMLTTRKSFLRFILLSCYKRWRVQVIRT